MKLIDIVGSFTDNEITALPFWGIIVNSRHGQILLAGIWFNREDAEEFFTRTRYRYPKKALVYCFSGCQSEHIKNLYKMATEEAGNAV